MAEISSINFKKSFAINTEHNDRTLAPSYLIDKNTFECNTTAQDARTLKNEIINNAIQAYNENKKPKTPNFKAKNYEWSAVVNIKPDTTMQDLEKLAEHFNKKYGFQCYQIAIHRDEGYINEQGEKVINHHAHLEFITLDKKTGKQIFKMRDFTPQRMREIQSEVAEILQMERGQDKRLSGAKRIEPRQYAQMKEQERTNTKELKAELNNTKQELAQAQETIKKLSKSAIKKRLEQERKAYLNTNKALHEQGAEPIFKKEHYRELKALENNDFKSLNDLELVLRELEKRIRKERREREQRKSNKKQVSFKNKDFKSALIDEYYSDLSTKHDLSEFFFDKEHKSLKNKAKNYEIIDNDSSLTLINANTRDLKEQVALMIKMCESKKWDLDNLKISGSKAFCDEFKNQLKHKKEQELAKKDRENTATTAQESEFLKAENEALRAENTHLKDQISAEKLIKELREYLADFNNSSCFKSAREQAFNKATEILNNKNKRELLEKFFKENITKIEKSLFKEREFSR